jgi:flavin reductase (DIM6/NTAB) family NADH-FMN oxidoreductase RutF
MRGESTILVVTILKLLMLIEFQVYSIQDITLPNTDTLTGALILGLIKKMHVRRSVLAEDGYTIDPERLNPVCRLGGIKYATLGKIIELRRPVWSEYATEIDKAVSPNEQS